MGEANEPQRNRPGSVSVEGPSKLMGGGDVSKKYPPLVEGANPAEPRFWDLCLYSANDVEALNIGYNASKRMV